MVFNIYQLDNLDYDDAEPLLEDYIEDALQAFVKSKTGKAHTKKYVEGGFWIGTFIEMAYLYGSHTLPKMSKRNAQEVMESILPRKLTLMDPSDTDDAIAELTAFWTFIDEVYTLRSAKAIAKYLQSIADKFPQWMFDPTRGGLAKQFLIQGTEAGFDMTTQDGITAFQEEYNRNLVSAPQPRMSPPEVPMTQAPSDMVRAFELLGLDMPQAGDPVNPIALMQKFLEAMEELDESAAEEMFSILETNIDIAKETTPMMSEADEPYDMRGNLLKMHVSKEPALTEDDAEHLRAQSITESSPGTILQDFQTLLDFIDENQVTLSSKLKHLSLKFLQTLNQRLSQPIEIDLKRPQQKSYPNINGLYLLARATNIVQVAAKGKQYQLVLNPDVHGSWQQLNPTEQYFSLLEAWFIRSHPDMLGEDRSGPMMMGDRCLQTWQRFIEKKRHTFSTYAQQDNFFYYEPGIQNVALMELFGLLKLTSAKPENGHGWRIKKLEVLPFGKSLMDLLKDAYLAVNFQWSGVTDPDQPMGELQLAIQPYFPEWQRSLAVPVFSFRPERHIFKVSLGKIWRRIAIAGDTTLAALSNLILDSIDFDHDHLDQFTVQTPSGRNIEFVHPEYLGYSMFGEMKQTKDIIKIGSLPLTVGSTMKYLFDFGDCWEFQVRLEAIEPAVEPAKSKGFAKLKGKQNRKSRPQKALGEIIEAHGKAPEQYPEYDGW